MTEADRIADELARAHGGDPWHGSSARAVLAGVSAAQAAVRPIPNAHTIWELVLHVTGWRREVARRLEAARRRCRHRAIGRRCHRPRRKTHGPEPSTRSMPRSRS
ncbi:MAG: DinB family protein [Gemmatimonadales bacterium]